MVLATAILSNMNGHNIYMCKLVKREGRTPLRPAAVAPPLKRVAPAAHAACHSESSAGEASAWLALAFDGNLDEIRTVRRNGLCYGAGDVFGFLNPDSFDAHAGCEVHEVERGAGDIHVLIGMLGAGFEILTPDIHVVFEDAVFVVRKHHEHDRELVVRGSPQRLDRIH